MRNQRNIKAGMTLFELIISVSILVTTLTAILSFQYVLSKRKKFAEDRVFAANKAVALLEELRLQVAGSSDIGETLDELNDELEYSNILTLRSGVLPDHPLSSNTKTIINNQDIWKFSRNVNISTIEGTTSANVRMAKVTVAINLGNNKRINLASVGALIQAPLKEYDPTQVYDLYVVTMETAPGWWVHMSEIKTDFETTLMSLTSANKGLQFRTHWTITAGYGRNQLYLPYLNEELHSRDDYMAFAYIYPGSHPKQYHNSTSEVTKTLYYVPGFFHARLNKDGVILNNYYSKDDNSDGTDDYLQSPQADKIYNPWPYSCCDRFNHDMRYPDAYAYYQKRKQAREEYIAARRRYIREYEADLKDDGVVQSGKDPKNMPEKEPEELSFRLLLEDMVTNPDRYHNSIFVNLHGELLPLPAMRNYSDAAKDPLDYPGVRAVTHPEKIWFRQSTQTDNSDSVTENVKFRVYSYLSDMTEYGDGSPPPDNRYYNQTESFRLNTPITMVFRDVDLTKNVNDHLANGQSSLQIQRISGGYSWTRSSGGTNYAKELAPAYKTVDGTTAEGVTLTAAQQKEMYALYRLWMVDDNSDGIPDNDDEGKPQCHTIVYLYNSPLCAPLVGSQGLSSSKRLYALEYIPCSLDDACHLDDTDNFSRDLTYGSDTQKNTARWVLTIPKNMAVSGISPEPDPFATCGNPYEQIKVETRIGRDLGEIGIGTAENSNESGIMYPLSSRYKPENISTTYTWWSTKLLIDNERKIPFTELFQFNGDPRHSPYVDTGKNGTTVPHGYNPYFEDVNKTDGDGGTTNNSSQWDRIIDSSKNKDGWGAEYSDIDIARYVQLVRRAIVNSELLYTTLTGYSYYYVAVGGEICLDAANGFKWSVEINSLPYGGPANNNSQPVVYGAEYTGAGRSGYSEYAINYIQKNGTNPHRLLFWIGELYHDKDYVNQWGREVLSTSDTSAIINLFPNSPIARADYVTKAIGGNIIAGGDSEHYRRMSRGSWGFGLRSGCRHKLQKLGCGSVLQIKNSSGKIFDHVPDGGNVGKLTSEAKSSMKEEYSISLPEEASASRPWQVYARDAFSAQYELANHDAWKSSFYCLFDPTIKNIYYTASRSSHSTDPSTNPCFTSALLALKYQPGSGLNDPLKDPYINTSNYGYININGLSTSTSVGTDTMVNLAIIGLLQSFFELGKANQAKMLPRIKIIEPEIWNRNLGSNEVTIKCQLDWLRWDGRTYTPSYDRVNSGYPTKGAADAAVDAAVKDLLFVPMLTDDIRLAWYDLVKWENGITDDQRLLREKGDRPSVDEYAKYSAYDFGNEFGYDSVAEKIKISKSGTDEDGMPIYQLEFTFTIADDTKFPNGAYHIRMECYRRSELQHYSEHQIYTQLNR